MFSMIYDNILVMRSIRTITLFRTSDFNIYVTIKPQYPVSDSLISLNITELNAVFVCSADYIILDHPFYLHHDQG